MEKIGEVNGQGNSSVGYDYQFIDNHLEGFNNNDTLKYFLIQVDLDGSEVVLGPAKVVIKINNKSFPEKFSIVENFPNPFNSETTIRYTLQASSNVVITIFDITGKKILFISERQLPGKQKVRLNLNGNSSGIYIVQIIAKFEDKILQSFIHKITLIK